MRRSTEIESEVGDSHCVFERKVQRDPVRICCWWVGRWIGHPDALRMSPTAGAVLIDGRPPTVDIFNQYPSATAPPSPSPTAKRLHSVPIGGRFVRPAWQSATVPFRLHRFLFGSVYLILDFFLGGGRDFHELISASFSCYLRVWSDRTETNWTDSSWSRDFFCKVLGGGVSRVGGENEAAAFFEIVPMAANVSA